MQPKVSEKTRERVTWQIVELQQMRDLRSAKQRNPQRWICKLLRLSLPDAIRWLTGLQVQSHGETEVWLDCCSFGIARHIARMIMHCLS